MLRIYSIMEKLCSEIKWRFSQELGKGKIDENDWNIINECTNKLEEIANKCKGGKK